MYLAVICREVASDTHRRQSLPSLEMKQLQQKDNIRRKSLTAMQAVDPEKGGRRESRSERHKRVGLDSSSTFTIVKSHTCIYVRLYVYFSSATVSFVSMQRIILPMESFLQNHQAIF